jgi:hypothetical protein
MFQNLKIKKYFLLVGVAFLFWLIGAPQVSACSCRPPQAPKEALKDADAVFSGQVVDIEETNEGINSLKVRFDVSRVWKGPETPITIVNTAMQGTACGYSFKKGEKYLVYAYKRDGLFHTGVCTRTKLLSNA